MRYSLLLIWHLPIICLLLRFVSHFRVESYRIMCPLLNYGGMLILLRMDFLLTPLFPQSTCYLISVPLGSCFRYNSLVSIIPGTSHKLKAFWVLKSMLSFPHHLWSRVQCIIGLVTWWKKDNMLLRVWEKSKVEERGGILRCTSLCHKIVEPDVWFGILIRESSLGPVIS